MTLSQPRSQVPDYPPGKPHRLDLHPDYAELRRQPLRKVRMPHGGEAWLATGYEETRAVMAEPAFSRALAAQTDVPRLLPEPPPDGTIMTLDPPEHTRLRRLVARAFTPRRVEALRGQVQAVVERLLDDLAAQPQPADLVQHLAVPLPVMVICDLLGVPHEDRDRFRAFTDGVMATTAFDSAEVRAAMEDFFDYFAGLVARRREHPTDDLLGGLVTARDDEDRLSEQELVWLGVALLIGGHETTLNQVANFTYTLLTHPRALRELRDDPDLAPRAVEELLRYIPTGAGSAFASVATADVEVCGVHIRSGEAVIVDLGAANRDPRAFDHPDTLDLRREPNAHLAMGHGPHFCLGAQLARMELQTTMTALLRRFPRLRLGVGADEVGWRAGSLIRGPAQLPVRW